MIITSLHLNLAFVFAILYVCNGAPPRTGQSAPQEQFYSHQEDDLMFKLLESLNGRYDPCIWRKIQKAHEEKLKANANGFFMPRSIKSLKEHFHKTLKKKESQVPDSVWLLYDQIKRTAITRQEQDFINNELLRPEYERYYDWPLFTGKRWTEMQKNHNKKRESGEAGFSYKRSGAVLRNHFRTVMVPKDLVLESVKRKFPEYFNDKEGELMMIDELLNEIGNGSNKNVFARYSPQEHKLMFEMLEPHAASYDPSVWKEIRKAFEENRNANLAGFVAPRSIKSLQQNLFNIIKNEQVPVPDAVKEVYEQMKRTGITRQEQDLINRELARTDLRVSSLNSNDRWKKIQEKHEEERKAGTLGFDNKRSFITLRNHFNRVMKAKDLVDESVKKRFPKDFETNQGAASSKEGEQSASHPRENMECDNTDDSDVWDPILEDLENLQQGPVDDHGIDHNMFLDPFYDNDFYADGSPYELRTFETMSP